MKTALTFLLKCLTYKNGSLLAVSTTASTGLSVYLNHVLEGTNPKNLIVPILAHIIGFTIFMLFTTVDFFTGLWVARFQHKRRILAGKAKPSDSYIKSYKLWRTLWKILGILLLTTMITFMALFAEVIQSSYGYWVAIWSEVGIWMLACGFEFHSIGENIEKRTGNKPEIFEFWDKVLGSVQRLILRKIDKAGDKIEEDADKLYDLDVDSEEVAPNPEDTENAK